MQTDWPFSEAPETTVLTTREIVDEGRPVVFVLHDAEDSSWQFHAGPGGFSPDDALVVTLGELVARAPELTALANLAPGWIAFRPGAAASWQRCRQADWDGGA